MTIHDWKCIASGSKTTFFELDESFRSDTDLERYVVV